MNDDDFLTKIAIYWIELGGDAEGVDWVSKKLKEKIEELS